MDKDIIFYSNFCTYCKEILTQISKTPLNDKLTYICVDDKNIQLPPFVQAVPTIYLTKEQKIIVDEALSDWIKSKTSVQESGDVMAYMGNGDFSASFSNLDDSPDKSFVSDFTYLDDPMQKIDTPQELSSDSKQGNKSYEQLENSRRMEFNQQPGQRM